MPSCLLSSELALIRELRYEHYFLTVWDLCRFARSRGILCQGRGSAANSAVCYYLGITAVDPTKHDLLFERFISKERNEPPDIDVDFEHERREEVFQYIYNKYGRERAGITAEVIRYRPRSAIRDVAKVFGLSLDRIDALAKSVEWFDGWTDLDATPPESGGECAAGSSGGQDARVSLGHNADCWQDARAPFGSGAGCGGGACGPVRNDAGFGQEAGATREKSRSKTAPASPSCLRASVPSCLRASVPSCLSSSPPSLPPRPETAPAGASPVRRALRSAGLDPADRTVRMIVKLVRQLLGFPRHLSQHVGGFVITETPLCEIVPLENGAMPDRTFIEWDKDDIDALGILKVDCLALGMLTAVSKCFKLLNVHRDEGTPWLHTGSLRPSPPSLRPGACPVASHGVPSSLLQIPDADPAVYDMICRADTIGVFQIESRAQMSMLPRLRPRNFFDLVIEVAIVRPGPIQGGMVHPYLRRRDGLEPVTYPNDAVRKVLHKTLGVPLFQEQVMRLAVVAAGFTPGEADQLRRAMAAWRRSGQIEKFQLKFIRGMLANGYSKQFAEQIYRQIQGFGEYGFPESHAASFALLVYASAWLKRYHPAAFCAAMLNSQPLGFYTPGQLVRDAIEHGVEVRPADVNYSEWDCMLEERDQGIEGSRDQGASRDRGIQGSRDREARGAHGSKRAAEREWRGERSSSSSIPRSLDPLIPGSLDPSIPSNWGCNGPALRLGLRMVRGLSEAKVRPIAAIQERGDAEQGNKGSRDRGIEESRRREGKNGGESLSSIPRSLDALIPLSRDPSLPIVSIHQIARAGVSRDTLLRLAAADAFRSLGLSRRRAVWEILALEGGRDPVASHGVPSSLLFDDVDPREPSVELPEMPLDETVVRDYDAIGFSLNAHPIGLVRGELDALKLGRTRAAPQIIPNERLRERRHGQRVAVAGLVTCRQRPGTAKGIVFITLEDETGMANLIVRPQVWERDRGVAQGRIALVAEGRLERQGEVIHVNVERLHDLSDLVARVRHASRDFH